MVKLLIGCDPELFVAKNGVFLSAHGLIPGNKRNPHEVLDGAVQVDGTALEFNIKPATNLQEFIHNTNSVLTTLKSMVPDYEVVISPTANFEQGYFDSLPEEAKELGCEPDYNAWFMSINHRPDCDIPMRTASGHIHVGWLDNLTEDFMSQDHFDTCGAVCRELDYYLGIQSLDWDKDNLRRSMYGAAGAFRPKPYGAEYRVLSNAWLKSEELQATVYQNTVKGVQNFFNGVSLVSDFGDTAKTILDQGDYNWRNKYPELDQKLKELIAA